jgi:hypothetical protein
MRPASELPVVRYAVAAPRVGWELGEETMPESPLHDDIVMYLRALLAAWVSRMGEARVARNLAVRWDEEHPTFGVDPDVCVLAPPPPEFFEQRSVRTWLAGHRAPVLAIEVVSETNPRKDYAVAPDKYAASGTGELVVFDPLLSGPNTQGGPFRLQLWRRDEGGTFGRVYAGEGPAYSSTLDAHLVAVEEGRRLRIANDAPATDFWLTEAEAERAAKETERAAKETERAAKEAERAAKEAALARVAGLEAELARRGS